MKIILASGSERRRHLLSWLGIPFKVQESEFDEDSIDESDPRRLVERLAVEKARVVLKRLVPQHSGSSHFARNIRDDKTGSLSKPVLSRLDIDDEDVLVIGADTVVAVGGEIIGKPLDKNDAINILETLSGRSHEVYTGVAVINTKTGSKRIGSEKTKVTFRKLSRKEIRNYVDTGEPMDKGGAYAIQMGAKGFVTEVTGSYTNVVGLPLVMTVEFLRELGCEVDVEVSRIIYEHTGYRS